MNTMFKLLISFSMIVLLSINSYSQCNSTNVAAGLPQGAAFATVTSDNLEPWRAFDTGPGSDTTHWGSTNGAQAQDIGIDFGQPLNVCSIYMRWGTNDYPTDFVVYGGVDFSHFNYVTEFHGNTKSADTFALPNVGAYNVIKIYVYARHAGSANYNLYDCKAYTRSTNAAPTVNLTSPASGVSYTQGTYVSLTATAADADGSIAKVQFVRGNPDTLIGESFSAPYSYTWTNAPVGMYNVRAKAIDNLGASTYSTSSSITVNAPSSSGGGWSLSGSNINNSNSGIVFIGPVPASRGDADLKLSVSGNIYAKNLTITQSGWPDYVFEKTYHLKTLSELEKFIHTNKHLPGITPAHDVIANGVNVGDTQAALLTKIEEMTLYLIRLNKELAALKKQVKTLSAKNKK